MNIYQDNHEYFQKIIHVSKQKLIDKYDQWFNTMREYTTLVFYNKTTKVARFEVAITHPKLDRFSREEGRKEVLKKLANEKAMMTVDLSELVKGMTPEYEKKVVSHLLSDFTHEIVPRKLIGKQLGTEQKKIEAHYTNEALK
jgi:hypothetical protein